MTVQVTVWPRGIRRRFAAGPLGETRGAETLRVGKPVFMSQVGGLVSVNVSTRYEDGFGGTDLLSWTVGPHGGFVGGMIRPGDHCRVEQGGSIVGEGEISEVLPQPDGSVEFHARGYAYNLSEYAAVRHDETFTPSITGGTAAPAAIEYPSTMLLDGAPNKGAWDYAVDTLGMPINKVVGTQTGWMDVIGDSKVAERPFTLAEVVTSREQLNGRRWAVWGRALFLVEDPTEPKWEMDTPEGLVGVADTDYLTHVGVWYRWWDPVSWDAITLWPKGSLVSWDRKWYTATTDVTGGGAPPSNTASWEETPIFLYDWMTSIAWAPNDPTEGESNDNVNRFDTRTRVVDYRGGPATGLGGAGQLASALYEQVKERFFLAGSFTVAPDGDLRSSGGGKAPIAFVRSSHGLKLNQLRTTQANLMPDFVVIGKTEWQWQTDDAESDGSESLTITPMGAPPRDFGSILAGIPYNPPSDSAVA